MEKFLNPGDTVSDAFKAAFHKKPCFLPRGIRSYNKSSSFANTRMQNSLPPALHGLVKLEQEGAEGSDNSSVAASSENKNKSENSSSAAAGQTKNKVKTNSTADWEKGEDEDVEMANADE